MREVDMALVDASFLTTDLTNLTDLFAWVDDSIFESRMSRKVDMALVDASFLTTDLTNLTDLFAWVDDSIFESRMTRKVDVGFVDPMNTVDVLWSLGLRSLEFYYFNSFHLLTSPSRTPPIS